MPEIAPLDSNARFYTGQNPDYFVDQVGDFSIDATRKLELGSTQLTYLYEGVLNKSLSMDLTDGLYNWEPKTHRMGLEKILKWLTKTASPYSTLKKEVHNCEFVSRRGPLSRVAISPYCADAQHDEGQKLACVKYKDVCFMQEFSDNTKSGNQENRSEYHLKATYAGLKFEKIVTVKNPGDKPAIVKEIGPHTEYNVVFKAVLKENGNSLSILCGAEVDCLQSSTNELVELKTQINCIGFGKNFESKAMKWWMQSYLVGIKQFAIGIHQDFILRRVELHQVDSFVKHSNSWKPSVCRAFLLHFLEKVKHELDNLPEGTIVLAERRAHASQFTFTVVTGMSEYEIISEQFKAYGWN